MRHLIFNLVLIVSSTNLSLAIQLWSSPGDLPTSIPASCRAALSQNITCEPNLVSAQFVASGRALSPAVLEMYCTDSCAKSLLSFKVNTEQRCGDKIYKMFPNSTYMQSGASVAAPLSWAYNVTCIKDDGGLCLPALYNGTKDQCSNCALQYGATMLSSAYGRTRIQPKGFSSLLSSCSAAATKYPYTCTSTSSVSASISPSDATLADKCTGLKYTVANGDTCQSISKSKSIAIDRLITANGLDYNCSSLRSGSTLCIGLSCKLRIITDNQTCTDILAGQSFNQIQLISWNPIIHANCDNLASLTGRSICVSPPGSDTYSAAPVAVTTMELSSMFPGPYTTGKILTNPGKIQTSWYNTQTSLPTAATQTYVANASAADLIAARTSNCPISDDDILNGITVADLPDVCQDLVNPWCFPDLDKPAPTSMKLPAICTPPKRSPMTTTTARDAKPTPIQSGAATKCEQYYKVLDGDNCYSIANAFKITLMQVHTLPLILCKSTKTITSSPNGIHRSEKTVLSFFSVIMSALALS